MSFFFHSPIIACDYHFLYSTIFSLLDSIQNNLVTIVVPFLARGIERLKKRNTNPPVEKEDKWKGEIGTESIVADFRRSKFNTVLRSVLFRFEYGKKSNVIG